MHSLGGRTSIEVTSVKGEFHVARSPKLQRTELGEPRVEFEKPAFGLLADASLSVRHCIVQHMNDAMFAVRGMYRGQDFSRPTRSEAKVAAKGYEIVQYPTTP